MLHSVELAYTSSGPGSDVIIIVMKEHTGKGQECQLSGQGNAWMET